MIEIHAFENPTLISAGLTSWIADMTFRHLMDNYEKLDIFADELHEGWGFIWRIIHISQTTTMHITSSYIRQTVKKI